jgi:hypothetical protein
LKPPVPVALRVALVRLLYATLFGPNCDGHMQALLANLLTRLLKYAAPEWPPGVSLSPAHVSLSLCVYVPGWCTFGVSAAGCTPAYRKRKVLRAAGLVLPWEPLYELFCAVYTEPRRALVHLDARYGRGIRRGEGRTHPLSKPGGGRPSQAPCAGAAAAGAGSAMVL